MPVKPIPDGYHTVTPSLIVDGAAQAIDFYQQAFKQAIAAGAKEERPVKDQFYGVRSGTLVDPFGHRWSIATHTEDVSPEEMDRRLAAMKQQPSPP